MLVPDKAEHVHHEVEGVFLHTLSTAGRPMLQALLTRVVHTAELSE